MIRIFWSTTTGPFRRVLSLRQGARTGLLYYGFTGAIVYVGVVLGYYYLPRQPHPSPANEPHGFLEAFGAWDGRWYAGLAAEGYSYNPQRQSNVAFFPAYPIAGRAVMEITGATPTLALLVVSNVFLAATFILLISYVRCRFGDTLPYAAEYVLLTFGLWPATFFFRMAYAESMFVFLSVCALYGMVRQWPLPVIAVIVGLATATRPVGVGLLLPFWLHIVDRSLHWRTLFLRLVYLTPLACWGIAGFVVYQAIAFGEPLAFARAQDNWKERPLLPLGDKLVALGTLEPIRAGFEPSSPCYWHRLEKGQSQFFFSLQALNPLLFLVTAAVIVLGTWKGWLSRYEWTLALMLLLIPYVTRGCEMCMGCSARYAAAVFPMYLVLGRILSGARSPMLGALLAWGGFLLGAYAALFAACFRLI